MQHNIPKPVLKIMRLSPHNRSNWATD